MEKVTFEDLNLNKPLRFALADLKVETPTPIQEKVFAPIMAGKDIVGIAQTGTGKTFAYLLPSLRLWKFDKSSYPQVLIVVPTRELVAQVAEEVRKLGAYMDLNVVGVYGKTNMAPQKENLAAGADVVVGTPGRLFDLMSIGVLKTKKIKRFIIDEVDEMLNLGFRTQLKRIVELLPEKRQNLMFSATMTEEVEQVIDLVTEYYDKIEAAPSGAPLENIEQFYYSIPNFNSKANLLELLLKEDANISKLLVFVGTKKMADALYERMEPQFEEQVGVIHSSKSQNNRFDVVNKFEDGTYRFIVATDVIARGLNVSEVTHIINFDLPPIAEQYIHRIGRTGRAEKKGVAISFISEKEQSYQESIEGLMKMPIENLSLPENLELSEELIELEIPKVIAPYDHRKNRTHEIINPGFHEKKDKNKKVNVKVRYADKMKEKYKNPRKRKPKVKGKKR